MPYHLALLILCIALIVAGQYFLTPPFSRWAFGAGVFVGVVWLILVLVQFIPL